MRYSSMHWVLLALCFAAMGWGVTFAEGGKGGNNSKGPEQVVIQSIMDTEKVAKPAYLAHQAHQWLECDGCHHGKGTGGKMIDYVDGQEIEKCETCHNSTTGMPERIATLKRASHMLCMECHLHQDKALAKCGVCHNKK